MQDSTIAGIRTAFDPEDLITIEEKLQKKLTYLEIYRMCKEHTSKYGENFKTDDGVSLLSLAQKHTNPKAIRVISEYVAKSKAREPKPSTLVFDKLDLRKLEAHFRTLRLFQDFQLFLSEFINKYGISFKTEDGDTFFSLALKHKNYSAYVWLKRISIIVSPKKLESFKKYNSEIILPYLNTIKEIKLCMQIHSSKAAIETMLPYYIAIPGEDEKYRSFDINHNFGDEETPITFLTIAQKHHHDHAITWLKKHGAKCSFKPRILQIWRDMRGGVLHTKLIPLIEKGASTQCGWNTLLKKSLTLNDTIFTHYLLKRKINANTVDFLPDNNLLLALFGYPRFPEIFQLLKGVYGLEELFNPPQDLEKGCSVLIRVKLSTPKAAEESLSIIPIVESYYTEGKLTDTSIGRLVNTPETYFLCNLYVHELITPYIEKIITALACFKTANNAVDSGSIDTPTLPIELIWKVLSFVTPYLYKGVLHHPEQTIYSDGFVTQKIPEKRLRVAKAEYAYMLCTKKIIASLPPKEEVSDDISRVTSCIQIIN